MADESNLVGEKKPQVNLVLLIKRTIEKVLDTVGMERNIGAVRLMASVLLNVAADYLRTIDEDPEVAIELFTAFLKGTPEEQKAAVQKYGEAAEQKKRIIVTGEGGAG